MYHIYVFSYLGFYAVPLLELVIWLLTYIVNKRELNFMSMVPCVLVILVI